MKLAICDDEIVFRKQLIESIDKYYKNYSNLDIYEFSSGEELLESYDSGAVYDIVFLDIEMKDINGLDTAKIIRKYRRNEIIVFLTSHTKYAIDGYEVNALRFLEKPINQEKLISTLDYIDINFSTKKSLLLHTIDGDSIIYLDDIIYLESIRNYVHIYTRVKSDLDGRVKEHKVRKNLKDFLEDLQESCFYRCHRSYIINLDYVCSYDSRQVSFRINIYNSSQIKNILYQNEVFLSIFGKIIISKVGGVVCRKN